MCFSRYFDVWKRILMCESRLDVFPAIFSFDRELSLIKFENVTSHQVACTKITQENSTIVHRVGSHNSPRGAYESGF